MRLQHPCIHHKHLLHKNVRMCIQNVCVNVCVIYTSITKRWDGNTYILQRFVFIYSIRWNLLSALYIQMYVMIVCTYDKKTVRKEENIKKTYAGEHTEQQYLRHALQI